MYYDVDTKHRGKYGYRDLARQLHIWHALGKAGLARLEQIPQGEYRLRKSKGKIKSVGAVR